MEKKFAVHLQCMSCHHQLKLNAPTCGDILGAIDESDWTVTDMDQGDAICPACMAIYVRVACVISRLLPQNGN